jgi:hypothetical protein
MNIRELGEAARKLKAKAVLRGDGKKGSPNTAWNELGVIYVHARRLENNRGTAEDESKKLRV